MNEGHLNNVFDLTYIKVVRFTMNCVGSWPHKELGNVSLKAKLLSLYNYWLMLVISTALTFQAKYVKTNTGVLDFAKLGHTYITLFMGALYWQRTTMPMQKRYCQVTKEFLTKFHLIHHKDSSEYAQKMNSKVQKICFVMTVAVHTQMYMGLCFYNMTSIYKNYSNDMFNDKRPVNSTFEHSIFYDLPVPLYTDPFWYWVVVGFNFYLSFSVVYAFCCFDLLLCLHVFHIWGHLNILKHRCNYFRKPALVARDGSPPWYTEEESKVVYKELTDIVEYHKMITEFMGKISSAYSVFLYVYFVFHQVCGCVLLLECSKMDAEALGQYGFLTSVQVQQLIQLSIVFELICTKGENVIDDVYGLPWECMDVKSRKLVRFFLQMVQKPIAIKAGDMVPVGVQTMFAILKASCSYFVMLTTFASEE